MYDVIVIGGGPAGVTAALRARELGATVALIERDRMGGTCTNDGCAPTRVLAKAARLWRDSAQFENYGLIGLRPELDFEKLLSRTQHVVYTIHEKKQLINHLETAGVEVLTGVGPASFVDPHTLSLPDGRRIEGKKFILCAGGRSRRLEFPGENHAITHNDIWSLKKLPESMIIVGGAATGCQVASIMSCFGVQVTIIEVANRILRVEDETVSMYIEGSFQRRGIRVITGIKGVEKIENVPAGLALTYRMEDRADILEAEVVFLSTGWLGNLDTLNLPAAGVETERNYVKVDDFLCTTAPHIFAAGDITGRMMLVQSAGMEALTAAENALLGIGQRLKHQIVPHGGFTDPEYASVGLSEEQARNGGEYISVVVPYADTDRAVIDDHKEGFCKLIVSKENHRLLGAHVVGEQALEIVHLVAAGMSADMWIEQLAELQIAYPTYTAVVGLAARAIVRELGVIPISPQWRSLGKPYSTEWEVQDITN